MQAYNSATSEDMEKKYGGKPPQCPRKFLSSIPHPLPAKIGIEMFHSMQKRLSSESPLPTDNSYLQYHLHQSMINQMKETYEKEKKDQAEILKGSISGIDPYPLQMKNLMSCMSNTISKEPKESKESSESNDYNDHNDEKEVKRTYPSLGFGRLEIRENNCYFTFYLDIPGLEKDKIDVLLKNSCIVVECTREPISAIPGMFNYSERPSGLLIRSISLPSDIDTNDISCSYVDGVLMIRIRKISSLIASKKIRVD